jgi:hypothetical protein
VDVTITREPGLTDDTVKCCTYIKKDEPGWFSDFGDPMPECLQKMASHIRTLAFAPSQFQGVE